MDDLLPVGTLVQVTPFSTRSQTRPYRAIVAGYDVFRTKYNLRDELWPGEFTKEALSWVFPREVEEIDQEAASQAAQPKDAAAALHAHELTADDAALLQMLAGSQWAPEASLTLPSGRTVTGAEISRWVQDQQG